MHYDLVETPILLKWVRSATRALYAQKVKLTAKLEDANSFYTTLNCEAAIDLALGLCHLLLVGVVEEDRFRKCHADTHNLKFAQPSQHRCTRLHSNIRCEPTASMLLLTGNCRPDAQMTHTVLKKTPATTQLARTPVLYVAMYVCMCGQFVKFLRNV